MASGIIEGYHLSPQQKQLWAHQKEAGWVPAWILLRIEGTVSPQRIVEAIDTLRQRHETLRTDFHTLAGVAFPLQVIGEGAMDSSHGPLLAEEVRARVDVEVEALRAALTSGKPRVHARVWTVSDALTYLWLGGPRFYFDARSLLLLRNELVELLQEREGALGLPLQYADYAQWHRDLLEDASSPEGARGLAFWHEERLAEGTRLCNDRTAERRGAAARACVSMERGLGEALLACCAKLGVAPSALLACAWTSLCARTFDAADLLLAYRCEEQMEQALAGCVGPLAVSMPLRLTLDLQTPFSRSACAADERLRRARVAKDWLWTMPGASNVRPSIGFSFIEAQDAGAAELRVSVESLRALGTDAMLDACCVRHGSNIALSIDYDTDCVAVAEAETLLRRFVMLLEQLLAEPELAVGSVNLLTESEIDELMRLEKTPVGANSRSRRF